MDGFGLAQIKQEGTTFLYDPESFDLNGQLTKLYKLKRRWFQTNKVKDKAYYIGRAVNAYFLYKDYPEDAKHPWNWCPDMKRHMTSDNNGLTWKIVD